MSKIQTIQPKFDSELVEVLFYLEGMRNRPMEGSTPPWIFYDVKEIIHLVESLASARIEGNKTTLVSAAQDQAQTGKKNVDEAFKEVDAIRAAIIFVEEYILSGEKIDEAFIREIHKITTQNLKPQNNNIPGSYRIAPVKISKTKVVTAHPAEISARMKELIDFINDTTESRNAIIKIAIVHHVFTVIHPFADGNGRTARLITYAMLLSRGFMSYGELRTLNPPSIFGTDRDIYFDMLKQADSGTENGIEKWCLFVAKGIEKELEKMNKLLNKDYVVKNIIRPVLDECRSEKLISQIDYEILKIAIEKDVIQRRDVEHLFGTTGSAKTAASREFKKMKDARLLIVLPNDSKKNVMRFSNNMLLPKIISKMDEKGLLPVFHSSETES